MVSSYWKTMPHIDFKLDAGELSLAFFSPFIQHYNQSYIFSILFFKNVEVLLSSIVFPLLGSRICPHVNY